MHRFCVTAAGAIFVTSTPLQWAQDPSPQFPSHPRMNPRNLPVPARVQLIITIPAGTRIPLSLIGSIHTKSARRGDVVHLETPVSSNCGYRDLRFLLRPT